MKDYLKTVDKDCLKYFDENYDIKIFLTHEKGEKSYHVIDLINNKTYSPSYRLKTSVERCRFCGKTKPEASFRSAAHIVPESLGNKIMFADNYECDECNKVIFNKYENDLNNLLKPFLAINGVKGKAGTRKYKSFDKKSYVMVEEGQLKFTQATDAQNKMFVDDEKKIFKIVFDIPAFLPKNIYKIIAKVALELLDETSAKEYSIITDYAIKNKTIGFEHFGFCFFPGINVEQITLIGYFLKNKDSMLPAYVFSIFSGNFLIQIPLFNNKQIGKMDRDLNFDFVHVPTPFDKTEFGRKYRKIYRANDETKVERHQICIEFSYLKKV